VDVAAVQLLRLLLLLQLPVVAAAAAVAGFPVFPGLEFGFRIPSGPKLKNI